MQLKKHNSKTPPEERPKWLRRGIALIAAIATLATGGIVASTAYAGGGGGDQDAGGSGTGDGAPRVFWQYKDDASGSFGPASDINSVKNAFAAAKVTLHEDSGSLTPMTKAKNALSAANNECVSNFHKRHPGEGDGDCRVVAVGAAYSNSGYWGAASDQGNHAELGGKNQWQYAWDTYIKPNQYHYAGSQPYDVNTAFTDDPGMSVQKIMARDTYDDINLWNEPIVRIPNVEKSIVVIVLDKYQPAPPSFTPTISTNAPHVIQEGQPITDNVTVGVKSGDHWIDGTSVTAKGYYFTGSKDAILKNIPYNGDPTDAGINNYLNQIKSAGGVLLGTKTETFTGPGQHTVTLDQKAPANTWGTWVWFINKNGARSYDVLGPQAVVESEETEASGRGLLGVAEVVGDLVGVVAVHAALPGHVDDLAEPSEHRLASGPFDLAVQFVEGQVAHDPHGVVHGDPVVVAGGQGGAPPVGDVQELVERQRAGELVHQQHLLVLVAVEGMQVVADAVHVLGRVSVHHVGGLAHARLPVQVVDLDVAAAAGVVDRPVPRLDEPREPSDASGGVVVGVREQYLVKGHALFDHAAQLFEVVAFALLVDYVVGGQAVEERPGVTCRYRRDCWLRRC